MDRKQDELGAVREKEADLSASSTGQSPTPPTGQPPAEGKRPKTGGLLRAHQEDEEDIARMLRDIRNDREGTFPPAVRYLGYGLGFFTLLALGIMTMVMVRDVRFASQVYGPSRLVVGERASFRLAIFEAESTAFLRGVQGTFWLVAPHRDVQIFHGRTEQDVLVANLHIPRWPLGTYTLRIRVCGPTGEETLERSVELVDATQAQGRYTKESSQPLWAAPESPSSPYRVRFFAEGRSLISDLPNRIYAWVQQRNTPMPTRSPRQEPTTSKTSDPAGFPTSKPSQSTGLSTSKPSQSTGLSTSKPSNFTGLATSRPSQFIGPSTTKPSNLTGLSTTKPSNFTGLSTSRPVLPVQHSSSKAVVRLFASPDAGVQRRTLLDPFAEPARKMEAPDQKADTVVWETPSHRVWLELREGMSRLGTYPAKEVQGIVRFPYVPQFFRVGFDTTVWGRSGRSQQAIEMKTEGYQMMAEPRQVLVAEEGVLFVRVDSLQTTAPLHIDLVRHGRRLWSTQRTLQDGRSEVSLKIPKGIKGLITLQVYTEFYFPGEVYDARLLYVGASDEQALRGALRKHLVERGDGMRLLEIESFPSPSRPQALEVWARAIFSFAKARFTPPSLLYDSSKDRLSSLRRYQHDFRRRTLMTLGGLGSFVLLGMFLWMFLGYRRDQARLDEFTKEEGIRIKGRGTAMIFLAILMVAVIFASILYLFWAIQWKYDNM